MYCKREDLMTPEELEEYNHDPSLDDIPTWTYEMREWLFLSDTAMAAPEASTCREFEQRPPAIGATDDLLNSLPEHTNKLVPVKKRILFNTLRSTMLRHLIACPGAQTVDDLVYVLREELRTGVPAPIPSWYKFSTTTMGPRKIGYDDCDNRCCFET
ncbi:hypothetical protein ACA910_015808 [Epithemia clementina (nom. ined.)]